jgi:hypothetical protein
MTRRRNRCIGCGIFFSSLSRHYAKSSCVRGGSKKPRTSPNLGDGVDDNPNDFLSSGNHSDHNLDDLSDDRTSAPDDFEVLDEYFIADCNQVALPSSTQSPSYIFPMQQKAAVLPVPGLQTGEAFVIPSDFQKGRFCFTTNDRSMMRMYNLCDEAGSPRYLMDQLLTQLKVEMKRNQFDPTHFSITKRDAFMARMHRKFPSPPPEAIQVQLESFPEPVTIYRFDAIQQLQAHLLRHDLYGNLEKLNVHPDHRWDQSFLPPSCHMREVTDSAWYKDEVSATIVDTIATIPSDLDNGGSANKSQYQSFLFPVEQYQDATGNDNKESSSLEPVMLGGGLLKSEFNGDHRSRFIIGYIPSFTKKKATAGKSKKKFGAGVRDYHKCMSILLEPLVKAQKDRPLLDVLLGDQIRRVYLIVVMAIILGDGKSTDMLCGRVMSSSSTLRLSRATFTPSDVAADTSPLSISWIKSRVIEELTRAALFDVTCKKRSEWNRFLHEDVPTVSGEKKYISAANRRVRICKEILKKALGSHAVRNAFFSVDFASEYGVYGHTLADTMHVLEEGLFKYLLATFLDPLSETTTSNLDDFVAKLLGPKANRCHGMRLFPRVNFTRGFSRLTLLSSEERVGELIALVIVLQTDTGRAILSDRFSPGFDARRKVRAARFSGNPEEEQERVEHDDEAGDEEEEEDIDVVEEDDEQELDPATKRSSVFVPTKRNIEYVCQKIKQYDLSFLFSAVFPHLPERHIFECLKIIWKMTFRLSPNGAINLPSGRLNIPPFRDYPQEYSPTFVSSCKRLITTFNNNWKPCAIRDEATAADQPTITTNPDEFVACCEKLLALRSFYNYSGEHSHEAIPRKEDGNFDVEPVIKCTREVGASLKAAVNRGEGTNGWKIPKFLDMLLLPNYMNRLGSTGRFHVGFAERGLKNWAKKPANTAQKRGGGVFEGQCAARIREKSMINHALTQMDSDSDEEDSCEEADTHSVDDTNVGGARFHIRIEREDPPNQRQRKVTCTRLNSRQKAHHLQIALPSTILHHFKTVGRFGQVYELRTEVLIEGTRYRAHPNYRGAGPWYDYATVKFEMPVLPDYRVFVNDNQQYPAKLVAFFRLLPETEFHVLAHCGQYQKRDSVIYSRRSLLTRSWLYEVTAGQNPRPLYQVVGSLRDNIHVKGHIFAIEENPGFHDRYSREEDKRFMVLSDMRKVWPRVFMRGEEGLTR